MGKPTKEIEIKFPENTIKSGEFQLVNEKKGLFSKPTSKKFIILTKDYLKAYKNKEAIPTGKTEFEIKITSETIIVKHFSKPKLDEDNHLKIPHTFGLKLVNTTQYFAGVDENERKEWFDLLKHLIERHKQGRKILTEEDIKFIEYSDIKKIMKMISDNEIYPNARVKLPTIVDEEEKLDLEQGFSTPREVKENDKDSKTFCGYPHLSTLLHIAVLK
jgi:hypothetical protein